MRIINYRYKIFLFFEILIFADLVPLNVRPTSAYGLIGSNFFTQSGRERWMPSLEQKYQSSSAIGQNLHLLQANFYSDLPIGKSKIWADLKFKNKMLSVWNNRGYLLNKSESLLNNLGIMLNDLTL